MERIINVVIAEDDLYACDLMSLLLARDWRTQVVAEGADPFAIRETIATADPPVHLLLLDTEIPGDPDWAFRLIADLRRQRAEVALLCTATAADANVLKQALDAGCNGYIVKDEIHYALAEAVVRAPEGTWVSTPSVEHAARQAGFQLPLDRVEINGTHTLADLSPRQSEVARLAVLFNQSRRDVADELGISQGQINKLVAEIYQELGLTKILSGETEAEHYFQDEAILRRFRQAQARAQRAGRSAREKPTLAFHLLTLAEVRERG